MSPSGRGTALVTGGPRRIGRELVRACAAAGYDVAIHCRREDDDAQAALAEVRAAGRAGGIFPCDLGDEPAVEGQIPPLATAPGPATLLGTSAALFRNATFPPLQRAPRDQPPN